MSYVVICGVLCILTCLMVFCVGQDAVAATTTIKGTDVQWEFSDSKGNDYSWNMPVVTYEDIVVKSRDLVRDKVNLQLNGETIRTVSLDGFVKKDFVSVIDDVYDNSYDNSNFIWEVWYIVSQLTVYDKDLYEYSEGRYALETFTRGGGDCEDLVILIADMLMSSSHTKDWAFEYVYMDSNNPTEPQTLNHVILVVRDEEYSYYIEATGAPNWQYFPDGVTGWWFEVVPKADVLNFTGANLAGMDLSHKDLNEAILTRTDLSEARLAGANLFGADMRYADLSDAYLANAVMHFADLSWADLSHAYMSKIDLFGALLLESNLRGADLTSADLQGADLSGANLAYSDITGGNLGDTSFAGADLSGADLTRVDLSGADLSWADLSGAYLRGADLSGALLLGANLRGATLVGADLSEALLLGANLRDAHIYGADLHGAILTEANLNGADLRGTFLVGANLRGSDLSGADLYNAITDHTTIMP